VRIAFISQYAVDEKLGGGVLRATLSKARGLSNLGHQINFIQLGDESSVKDQDNMILTTVESRTYKRDNEGKAISDRIMKLNAKTFLRNELDKFSPEVIISIADYNIGSIVLGYSRAKKIRFYYYPHIIISKIERFVPKDNIVGRIAAKFVLKPFLRNFISYTSGIICINTSSAQDFERLKIKTPIIYVSNSIDYKLFSTTDKSKMFTKRLLYVGLICERKNQKYFLNMINKLPYGTELYLAGQIFDHKYYNEMEQAIQKQGLKVKYLGELSQDEIKSEMEQANLFVSASKLEVQSLVILEALSSGTPVVMLENETTIGLEQIDGLKVLNQDTTPTEFAEEVLKIFSLNTTEYIQLSESLKKYASRFSEEETCKDLFSKISAS